jgi:hypothetical protein
MAVRTLPRDPPDQGKNKNNFKHGQDNIRFCCVLTFRFTIHSILYNILSVKATVKNLPVKATAKIFSSRPAKEILSAKAQ